MGTQRDLDVEDARWESAMVRAVSLVVRLWCLPVLLVIWALIWAVILLCEGSRLVRRWFTARHHITDSGGRLASGDLPTSSRGRTYTGARRWATSHDSPMARRPEGLRWPLRRGPR